MLSRMVYYSEAAAGLTRADIEAILRSSAKRNPAREVTGALVWDGARFMQLLEGHRITLTELLLKISADPRHRNLVLVSFDDAEERLFPGWAMRELPDAFGPGRQGAAVPEPYGKAAAHFTQAFAAALRAPAA